MIFLNFMMYICVRVLAKDYQPSDPNSIIFGQSCALSGASGDLGSEMSKGIMMAFNSANRAGGVLGGKMLNLSVLDDGYEPHNTINNTAQFLNSSDIFGLLGYVGTPTILSVSEAIKAANIPLIGSLTGSTFLRTPFNELFINVRSSYDDEATAMINYLVRKKFRLGISILYQNDSFGINAYNSLLRSLGPYNIDVIDSTTFNRNSVNESEIVDAVALIGEKKPDAVVLAGTYEPLGKFIYEYQRTIETEVPTDFVIYSFVGTVSISKELDSWNTTFENTVVMETVPNIILSEHSSSSSSYELVKNYLEAIPDGEAPSFHAFEGYIVGRLTVEMVRSTFGEFSRENFLKSIYETNQVYYVDGFKLGPFSRTNDTGIDKCNQASHKIYPVRLINTTYFSTVEEAVFEWSGCLSEPTISKPVIFLKQSAATKGTEASYGLDNAAGVKSAVFGWNAKRALEDRIIGLVTVNDGYNSSLTRVNTLDFLEDTEHPTFAFFGYWGTPTFKAVRDIINETRTPSIGFLTGSDALRGEGQWNVLNLRVGYNEEVFTLIQYAFDLKFSRFSMHYMLGFEDLEEDLRDVLNYTGHTLISSIEYDHHNHDFDFTYEIDYLLSFGEIPEVMFTLGTHIPMARFVYGMIDRLYLSPSTPYEKEIYFGFWSPCDPLKFMDELKKIGCNTTVCLSRLKLFFSEVVPYYDDKSKQIVVEYQENMKTLGLSYRQSFVSIEGYLNGLFFTTILEQFSNEEIDNLQQDDFIQKVYDMRTISVRGISLGPYIKKTTSSTEKFCNTGLREAWIVYYNRDEDLIDATSTSKTFPYCSGDAAGRKDIASFMRTPIFFGISNDFGRNNKTREFGSMLENGLNSESSESIENNLYILQKDDGGETQEFMDNLDWFTLKNVFAYVGFSRNGEIRKNSPVHTIGLSEAIFGTDPKRSDSNNALYFRPFLLDEIFYVSRYYQLQGYEPTILLPGDDETQEARYFEQYFIRTITGSLQEMITYLDNLCYESRRREIVIYNLGSIDYFRETIYPSLSNPSGLLFVFPSRFDRAEYSTVLPVFRQITFYSRNSLFFNQFVSEYGDSYEYIDNSFYGYLVGKWIASNFISSVGNKREFFSQAFDSTHSITFESEVMIDFSSDCNVGIRKIYLYDESDVEILQKDFDDDSTLSIFDESLEESESEKRRKRCTLYDTLSLQSNEKIDTSRYLWVFLPPSIILFSGVFLNIFGICVFCCCFCIGCSSLLWVCFIVFFYSRARKRLKKFDKLRDVDLLIKEQELEQNSGIAHLRINKGMFEIKISEIEIIEILGKGGSSSTVYKAKFRNRVVAFKCFRTQSICQTQNIFDEFEKEVQVMSSISHPNIVQFYGACLDPPRVGFVMEYCELGDLSDFLQRYSKDHNGEKYPFREKMSMVTEIASSCDYIHSRRIIHRDLKPENILVDNKHSCKLMDFGLSRIVSEISSKKTKAIGTSDYIAPEVIKSSTYNEKCDVFSFGILLFVIFTQNFKPYGQESFTEIQVAYNPDKRPNVFEIVRDRSIPVAHKAFLIDLMEKLWHDVPKTRLGFDEITAILTQRLEKIDSGDASFQDEVVQRRQSVVADIRRYSKLGKDELALFGNNNDNNTVSGETVNVEKGETTPFQVDEETKKLLDELVSENEMLRRTNEESKFEILHQKKEIDRLQMLVEVRASMKERLEKIEKMQKKTEDIL